MKNINLCKIDFSCSTAEELRNDISIAYIFFRETINQKQLNLVCNVYFTDIQKQDTFNWIPGKIALNACAVLMYFSLVFYISLKTLIVLRGFQLEVLINIVCEQLPRQLTISFVAYRQTCCSTGYAEQLSRQTCSYYCGKFDMGMYYK